MNPLPRKRRTTTNPLTDVPSRRLRQSRVADSDGDEPRATDSEVEATPVAAGLSRLPEWHAMTGPARKTAWRELVEWVAWLHDRYDLALDGRLPLCCAQHPGLVEELWALRAMRTDIYTSTPAGDNTGTGSGAGQAARYWHHELWQVIAAAARYAPRCLSGHKPSTMLASVGTDAVEAWRDADPLIGIDPQLVLQATELAAAGGVTATDATIVDALMRGTATPLGALVTDYIQYLGTWWTRNGDTWLRVDDPDYTRQLDAAATRLRHADQAVTATTRLTNGH